MRLRTTTKRYGSLSIGLHWVMLPLSAAGKPIPFFGLHLPALISQSKNTADFIKEIHETGGTVGYFLLRMLPAGA